MDALGHHRSMSRVSELSAMLEAEDEKPVRCAKFRRQELWAFKPVWSPSVVAGMYLTVAIILIPLGVTVLVQSSRLMSTSLLRYDQYAQCKAETRNALPEAARSAGPKCILQVSIPRRTRGRSFLYYGLTNMYQNARRYATSRSFKQLMGRSLSVNDLAKSCRPCPQDSCKFDFFDPNRTDPKNPGGFLPFVPCGLTARSMFNDTFKICRDQVCNDPLNVSQEGIAWAIDRERFQRGGLNTEEQNAVITSEEFMVWMRLAPYRMWHKLSQRILEPLENRTYFVHVESNYPVESFDGRKYIYFMESTWFGGPNHFLGIASIAVGGLALLLAVLYAVRSRFAPDPQIPPETKIPWNDADGPLDSPAASGANPSPAR